MHPITKFRDSVTPWHLVLGFKKESACQSAQARNLCGYYPQRKRLFVSMLPNWTFLIVHRKLSSLYIHIDRFCRPTSPTRQFQTAFWWCRLIQKGKIFFLLGFFCAVFSFVLYPQVFGFCFWFCFCLCLTSLRLDSGCRFSLAFGMAFGGRDGRTKEGWLFLQSFVAWPGVASVVSTMLLYVAR